MKKDPGQVGQAGNHAWYDVIRVVIPFGLRELLGRIQAPSRAEADRIAAATYPGNILVSLSCKPKRPRRRFAIDLGNMGRRP